MPKPLTMTVLSLAVLSLFVVLLGGAAVASPYNDALAAQDRALAEAPAASPGPNPRALAKNVAPASRESAEPTDPAAQTNLGDMYYTGTIVEQDDAEAARLFRLAAEQGYAPAQYKLARLYSVGLGVTQDDGEAARWFRKAADQGHDDAQFSLGLMYLAGRGVSQDVPVAVALLRKAADQGSHKAAFFLARMFATGEGVLQNRAEAAALYRRSAESGFAPAQHEVGSKYADEPAGARDDAEAVRWFGAAAEQNYGPSQIRLGFMYEDALGVGQDFAEAHKWYSLAVVSSAAANLANRDLAVKRRDQVAAKMSPDQIDDAQARLRKWVPTNPDETDPFVQAIEASTPVKEPDAVRLATATPQRGVAQIPPSNPGERLIFTAKKIYRTKGHPKALGVDLSLRYPDGWTARESKNPNIVQSFDKDGGGQWFNMTVRQLPPSLTPNDVFATILDEATLRAAYPDATGVQVETAQFDGGPARLAEYVTLPTVSGQSLLLHQQVFSFLTDGKLIQVTFAAQINERDTPQKDLYRATFREIVSGISVPGQAVPDVSPAEEEQLLDRLVASGPFPGFTWLDLIVSAFVTWGLGLAPALLIRYVIKGQPISPRAATWTAALICAAFWIAWRALLLSLDEKPGTGGAWVLVFFVSRWIMSRAYAVTYTLNGEVQQALPSSQRRPSPLDNRHGAPT